MKELMIKKCLKCGATVEVLHDCHCKDCGIACCGQNMVTMRANTADASVEKHKPSYKKEGDILVVAVPHVMEDEHYIEWIACVCDGVMTRVEFKPNAVAEAKFDYQKGAVIYSYCNKHGLWSAVVE